MSLFDNFYPKVDIGYKPEEYPGLRKGKYKSTCWFCGAQTRWYDKISEEYCCQTRCLDYARKEKWFSK